MIKKFLYDHCLQIFSSIVSIVFLALLSRYWNFIKELILQVISYSATGWILFLMLIVIFGIKKLTKKKQSLGTVLDDTPPIQKPRGYLENLGYKEKFGVIWKLSAPYKESEPWKEGVVSSNDNLNISNLWVEEKPFCPKCYPKRKCKLYRNDAKNIWYCVEHRFFKKRIKIPEYLREDTRDKVIESFKADFEKEQNEK